MFYTREQAGKELAKEVYKLFKGKNIIVLAIPRGGVPVGIPIARKLKAKFDLVIPRKIPIPWNPEAGFGAVTSDGSLVLNRPLVKQLGLSKELIKELSKGVIKEIKRRVKVYRKNRPSLNLKNKTVVIVDDGLASGYTMLAAVKSVKKQKPKSVFVAVPVSSYSAYREVRPKVNDLICLHTSAEPVFAVASFYHDFPELADEEIIELINKIWSI